MRKVVRGEGLGRIIGAAAGDPPDLSDKNDMLEKHIQSVRSLKFRGNADREDVGSAGYDDPEGGPRSHWAVSVSGTIHGPVYIPHDLLLDSNQFMGASGPASFLKRTLLEDVMPDSVEYHLSGAIELTNSSANIKSLKLIKPDIYEVEVDIQVDGIVP